MKKVDIALLVMAGALAGALVMRLVQRPTELAMKRSAPTVAALPEVQSQPRVQPASDAKPSAFPEPETKPEQRLETPPAAPENARTENAQTENVKTENVEPPRPVSEPARAKRSVPRPKPRIAPPVAVAETPRRLRILPPAVGPQAAPVSDAARIGASAAPIQTPAAPPVISEQPQETPPVRMEPENATPVSAPTVPQPNQATLNAGMLIPVRLLDSLSSERNHVGDIFAATLDSELVASGFVVAERGARVEGRVTAADRNARKLSIELIWVHTSDNQDVPIQTLRFDKQSDPDRSDAAIAIGGGAVAGAVIGGMAAGGKGAAIGAAAGGGVGAGDVMLTRKAASLSSETRLTFRLRAPVTITERTQ